jgi:aminoglycoside 3-N-acetyltransferase
VRYDDLDHDDEDFVWIGDAFVAAGGEQRHALLGNADVTAVRARSIVDFAAEWMSANRPAALQET